MKTTYAKTISEVGKRLGVCQSTVVRWLDFGAPKKTRRGYPVEKIDAWRKKNIRSRGRPVKRGENGAHELIGDGALLLRAQRKEREAKAELARIQADLARGQYISVDQIKERDRRRIAAVRRGLLALPKAVAPLVAGLSPPEAEQMLDTKVRDLLQKFSEM